MGGSVEFLVFYCLRGSFYSADGLESSVEFRVKGFGYATEVQYCYGAFTGLEGRLGIQRLFSIAPEAAREFWGLRGFVRKYCW